MFQAIADALGSAEPWWSDFFLLPQTRTSHARIIRLTGGAPRGQGNSGHALSWRWRRRAGWRCNAAHDAPAGAAQANPQASAAPLRLRRL